MTKPQRIAVTAPASLCKKAHTANPSNNNAEKT